MVAGMGSGLTGDGVLAMETSWVAGWRAGATREATGVQGFKRRGSSEVETSFKGFQMHEGR